MDETSWNKILSSVKPLSISIAGLLSSAKPIPDLGHLSFLYRN